MQLSNRQYYDVFSKTYETHRQDGYHVFLDELESGLVRRYLTPSSVLLEAGCGTGLILSRLAGHAKTAIGVDLSGGMLRMAASRGLSVTQGSITALPFADASFDVVCSFKVLAHVQDIQRALAELTRVLRPGGVLLVEFYNRHSLRYLIKRLKRPTHIATSGSAPEAKAAATVHDEAVYTRYDSLDDIRGYLPQSLTLTSTYGLRVLTPHSALHRLPLIAPALYALESHAAELPYIKRLGGFLIVICHKAH